MVKMKFTSNQTAFEYALYMIASSYFDKVKCKSTFLESNMLLQYREQKLENQYKMEQTCIAYMNKLRMKLPQRVFKQNMQAHLIRKENGSTEILFVSKKYILELHGVYAGNDSTIDFALWVKKSDKPTKDGTAA